MSREDKKDRNALVCMINKLILFNDFNVQRIMKINCSKLLTELGLINNSTVAKLIVFPN